MSQDQPFRNSSTRYSCNKDYLQVNMMKILLFLELVKSGKLDLTPKSTLSSTLSNVLIKVIKNTHYMYYLN